MSHALVWGLGKSGYAAAQLLRQKGWEVAVTDRQHTSELQARREKLVSIGVSVTLGQDLSIDLLENLQVLIVSPGISWQHPLLVTARQKGILTWGEVELAWQYLHHVPWIGITGTNGKTTTTALIAHIFAAAHYCAPACGNIGIPVCDIALQETTPDWIVAELSSYQIEASPSVRPRIGIWTTFTPDHLSRHGTLENYARIKAYLLHQSQQRILNGDDAYLARQSGQFSQALWTSSTHLQADAYLDKGWVWFQGEPIVALDRWQLLGKHNWQNLLLSIAAARLAGISPPTIASAVATFRGIPHRLERLGILDGVQWINDSKATNYDAALIGLQAVEAPVILIAGGEAKEGEPQAWLREIEAKAAYVLLIGAAAPLFAGFLSQIGFTNYDNVETLEAACDQAVSLAQSLQCSAILFSPACASFDQYANFEQRGDHFRQLYQAKQGCQECYA